MSDKSEIIVFLQNKQLLEHQLESLSYGSIEIRGRGSNKYIYVHYREDGVSLTKCVDEYSDDLYNLILNNNIKTKKLKRQIRSINKGLKKLNYTENEMSSDVEINIDFAKKHLVQTIYKQAILEGVATTFADTESIIEVGKLTESILPIYDVRLIAVNDGVDSDKGEDDFTPFRNIMNEWYAKDMSRKMRSTLKIKSNQGYAIDHPTYGYKYDEIDKKRWAVDEEAADVVRHIFNLRKQGESVNGIAKILKKEKIYIPSVYAIKKGFKKPLKAAPLGKYLWTHVMVRSIISNQSYVVDVINFKTYSKSFKLKKRIENDKENWQIHKEVHEPIISRELFEIVQKTFKTTKCQKPRQT